MKKMRLIVPLLTVAVLLGGCKKDKSEPAAPDDILTAITDPAFKAYAQYRMTHAEEGDAVWDTNGDGMLSPEEAATAKFINVRGGYPDDGSHKVASMAGIQYFTGLTYLSCSLNSLKSLDVSKNPALTQLYCYNNSLTGLDVRKNPALAVLVCRFNALTSLDVSKNPALVLLDCCNNSLKKLDVSKNTALSELYCYANLITDLDASKMAFTQGTEYMVYCGQQKKSDGESLVVELTVRPNQVDYWNSTLRHYSENMPVGIKVLP